MSILNNTIRNGNFTSSQIWKLTKLGKDGKSFGAPALTYIKEKKYEQKLKRSLSTDVSTRPILWGKFLEPRVHDLLPNSYEHINDETLVHPKFSYWVGSPDNKNVSQSTICDTKCYQPKAFAEYVDNLQLAHDTGDISIFKDNHPEEYWQLTSNAILSGMENIEAIVYMPYESELMEIRMAAENFDGDDQFKYRFIYECDKRELAYLPDDSEYKNLNIFRFPLNKMDVIFLTQQVQKAYTLLTL